MPSEADMHDQITDAEYQHDLRDLRRRQGTPEYADARRAEIAQRAWALLHDAGACLEFINEHGLADGVEVCHAGGRNYLLDAGILFALLDSGAERESLRGALRARILQILAADDGPIARAVDREWRYPS
jgi:hypothetical protein